MLTELHRSLRYLPNSLATIMTRFGRLSLPSYHPTISYDDVSPMSPETISADGGSLTRPILGFGKLSLRPQRRGSASSILSSASSSGRRRRKLRERHDWLRKFSPLGSSRDLLEGVKAPTSIGGERGDSLIVDPASKEYYYWLAAVTMVTVYYLWTVILRTAFDAVHNSTATALLWFLLDLLCFAVYAADIYMRCHTSYLHDGILEEDLSLLKRRYFASATCYVDVLAILPLDLLYLVLFWTPAPPYLHWPRLLKIYRLKEFFDRTESYSHSPHTCRVVFLIHDLLVIIHWNACIYFLLSKYIGYGNDEWVYPAWNSTDQAQWGTLTRQYVYCFYWSTLTLTTIGELPKPFSNIEFLFVTFDYLVGILMFATLVGNMGGIIANMRRLRTKFQHRMDSIKVYMHQMKVPSHLQERVIKWFDYLCTHGHPIDDQTVLNYLPDKLKAEIGIHVHFETLKKVDFFEECEQGLLWELVLRLQMQVYSPGEYVCRKGDVGREMYIVSHGKLEVLTDEHGEVLNELKPGDYFGEISVLNLGRSMRRRTAFVRSVGYSDLLCLSQIDLLEVMQDYPRAMETLRAKGQKKLNVEQGPSVQPSHSAILEESASESEHEQQTSNTDESDREYSDTDSRTTMLSNHVLMDQIVEIHLNLSKVESMLKELLGRNSHRSSRSSTSSSMGDLSFTVNGDRNSFTPTLSRKISSHV